ncbi:hypothetical protein J7W16_12170 [Bacillus sp. YZJH907-2]|uniref:DUF5071 domain-containing protein n=2 Tax=Halalkalibacter suaedae TaxID=2822140 RepID=A0A940WWI1_9BACI|nr:hypothetical protein [Bacillus suaedae]
MKDYLDLEEEEIIYYVYNLNWSLPKEAQEESILILSQLPEEKVDRVLPKYGKECWQNGVLVIKKIGYPRNKKALPKLARLLQDRNWPGALEAIEVFRSMGREISVPYIEKECEEALRCHDADWLEHLCFACDCLNLTKSDFSNEDNFLQMKKLAEGLD